ncbi:hypothetical protein ACNY67_06995 [Pantoea sp. KXB45]|uniref:hypothetical protein n=1 Tax=Pantoea sp. KXB45 TaxID=3402309 RepID=UPI003AB5C832
MIGKRDLEWIFGQPVNLSPALLDSVLRFTLAFSYAEHKLMRGWASTREARDYAKNLLSEKDFKFDIFENYFFNRYSKENGFEQKLRILCNNDNQSYNQINAAFTSNEISKIDRLEALFRVCIRLRNNLFHGEKWSYMLRDQESNLDMATKFIVAALRHSGE